MKLLSGGLVFFCVSTVAGLLFGMLGHGLGRTSSTAALIIGAIAALLAGFGTIDPERPVVALVKPETSKKKRRSRREEAPSPILPARRYSIWFWIMAALFACFALRSFCWLLYIDGDHLKIQSPNNLGDLSLHLSYIRYFANGVPLWPDNPIHYLSTMRYPAGVDLFNGMLSCMRVDLIRCLVWTGLLGSLATFYALYRWGGSFTIAGFLFNGGLAGFKFFSSWQLLDYQGVASIAWKSIPLSMFVTQRGFLYAFPAGLLLLCHWREQFFPPAPSAAEPSGGQRGRLLPFWVELTLYASMPLFHVHTFLALSALLGFWLIAGQPNVRRRVLVLLGSALIPATAFVGLITDRFHARSILKWQPGWVQSIGDFKAPFFRFWILNFGILIPLLLWAGGAVLVRWWRSRKSVDNENLPPQQDKLAWLRDNFARLRQLARPMFLFPAALLFLFACLVKTAPWEWDNIKLIVWSYLIILPFLWRDLIARWPLPIRCGICIALFTSGFITLAGGLNVGRGGFDITTRSEDDTLADAIKKLPIAARFAGYSTFNHPLLIDGRKMVLGYPGHLWTQGFDYGEAERKLTSLMTGAANWKEIARELQARYLFWGEREQRNYPSSRRPWERAATRVASGRWGAIYDLETPIANGTPR